MLTTSDSCPLPHLEVLRDEMAQKRHISEVEGAKDTDQEGIDRATAKALRMRKTSPRVGEIPQSLEMPSKGWSPKAVPFQKPFQLISFSYTPERKLVFDNSAMKFWVDPPRGADLSHRYEHWTRRGEEKNRLDGLLKAISEGPCKEAKRRAQVVCWRGILCK